MTRSHTVIFLCCIDSFTPFQAGKIKAGKHSLSGSALKGHNVAYRPAASIPLLTRYQSHNSLV